MLSPETLESYRKMTPGERLRLTFELMQGMEWSLLSGKPEQIDRKFELMRKENELRNRNMLAAISRAKTPQP